MCVCWMNTEWFHSYHHNTMLEVVCSIVEWMLWFLQMNMQRKGKTKETRQEIETSDLLLFQKSLEDRIRLYEKEKEMEGIVMNKVTLYAYYKTLQV